MGRKVLRVYSVVPRERGPKYWHQVGTMHPHAEDKGVGWNILLDSAPIHGDGKLVVREVEVEDKDDASEEPAKES